MEEYYRQSRSRNDPAEQFKRDTALWYGALMKWGISNWLVLHKVFAILYYGGLMIRRNNGWETWQSQDIPIAAALSHSARVLVQLPKLPDPKTKRNPWEAPPADIWGFLNDGSDGAIQKRGVATHTIKRDKDEVVNGVHRCEMVNNVPKCVREDKAKLGAYGDRNPFTGKQSWGVEHYGMNIALGGDGNRNPFSGNVINARGQHGHLYFCYKEPTVGEVGGLLISAEQSSPADTFLGDDNKPLSNYEQAKLARKGVDDQTGGTHGTGGHNQYSATGGDDWSKGRFAEDGVGPEEYNDGMYVDLSQPYQCKAVLDQWNRFEPSLLDWTGEEPPTPDYHFVPQQFPGADPHLLDKLLTQRDPITRKWT
jgi:hypothetical protein